MKKALLPIAVATLLAFPAAAQEGPGITPAPTVAPATAAQPQEAGRASAGRARYVKRMNIYDPQADAQADLAAAVAKAKKEKKRVLVTLGGNWCSWCRALDRLFTKNADVAAAIAKSYVPVKVDVGRMTKNLDLAGSWGADPKKGVPLLVVLDRNGKAVRVQETGSFEVEKEHDQDKVIAFLEANAR